MSDSPASRPKRNSSFASFYIDEDDFEDDSTVGKSKKTTKEEVFVIAEKYDSDSDSKSIAYESSGSDSDDFDEFESKKPAKTKANPVKKQSNTTKKAPTKQSNPKPKSTPKATNKNQSKAKNSDDDEFELVVDDESDSESVQDHETKNNGSIDRDENFDDENIIKSSKPKAPATKKAKITQPKKLPTSTVAPRPSPASIRPKFPSSVEKVRIPGQMNGPRRVGLSRSAPTRPLSPVKLKKFD